LKVEIWLHLPPEFLPGDTRYNKKIPIMGIESGQ
jgi:hypothetical protein